MSQNVIDMLSAAFVNVGVGMVVVAATVKAMLWWNHRREREAVMSRFETFFTQTLPPADEEEDQVHLAPPPPFPQEYNAPPIYIQPAPGLMGSENRRISTDCADCGVDIIHFHNVHHTVKLCRYCSADPVLCSQCRGRRAGYVQFSTVLNSALGTLCERLEGRVYGEMNRRVDAMWNAPGMPGFNYLLATHNDSEQQTECTYE